MYYSKLYNISIYQYRYYNRKLINKILGKICNNSNKKWEKNIICIMKYQQWEV